MIKVMLVDDERIAVQHMLRLIDWRSHGYDVVATASNGKSALEKCEQLRPHIVFVDIRMPVMDGLELIRAAAERKLGVKFIVLSAYEDFEYARKAFSVGSVSNYLIKHEVTGDLLLRELGKARADWEAEEANRRSARNQALKAIVSGAVPPSADEHPYMKGPLALLCLQADAPFPVRPSLGATGETPMLDVRWAEALDALREPGCWKTLGAFADDGGLLTVVLSATQKSALAMTASLHELARGAAAELRRRFAADGFGDGVERDGAVRNGDERNAAGRDGAIGAPRANDRTRSPRPTFSAFYALHAADPAALPAAYQKLKSAARHAVFCGRQAVLPVDELRFESDRSPAAGVPPALLADVVAQLKNKDANGVSAALAACFDAVRATPWSYRTLVDLTAHLHAIVSDAKLKHGFPAESAEDDNPYTVDDVEAYFRRQCLELIAAAERRKPLSGKLLKALQYIRENYARDLSIDDVSYAVGISCSYLHQLFKRELDRTFLDYLTEFRVLQAKRILSAENAKMAEVAQKVGYRSPQHFSQVFKRVTGLLPHQYREGEQEA